MRATENDTLQEKTIDELENITLEGTQSEAQKAKRKRNKEQIL